MQGEYTGVYPGLGKEGPTSSGGERVLYFLAPKCLRRGYKLCEREPVLSLKRRVKSRIRCGRCSHAGGVVATLVEVVALNAFISK
jgi:hypothetical protein